MKVIIHFEKKHQTWHECPVGSLFFREACYSQENLSVSAVYTNKINGFTGSGPIVSLQMVFSGENAKGERSLSVELKIIWALQQNNYPNAAEFPSSWISKCSGGFQLE